jgi:hypothetical protein
MYSKLARYTIYGSTAVVSAHYAMSQLMPKEYNALGHVRFGRAALTVIYLFSFILLKSDCQNFISKGCIHSCRL